MITMDGKHERREEPVDCSPDGTARQVLLAPLSRTFSCNVTCFRGLREYPRVGQRPSDLQIGLGEVGFDPRKKRWIDEVDASS